MKSSWASYFTESASSNPNRKTASSYPTYPVCPCRDCFEAYQDALDVADAARAESSKTPAASRPQTPEQQPAALAEKTPLSPPPAAVTKDGKGHLHAGQRLKRQFSTASSVSSSSTLRTPAVEHSEFTEISP